MSDREAAQRLDFLKAAGLADAVRAPLPGDASTRRYERLTTADGPSPDADGPGRRRREPALPIRPGRPSSARPRGWNAVARLSGRPDRGLRRRRRPPERRSACRRPRSSRVDAAERPGRAGGFRRRPVRPRHRGRAPTRRPSICAAVEALAGLHAAPTPADPDRAAAGDWPLQTYDADGAAGRGRPVRRVAAEADARAVASTTPPSPTGARPGRPIVGRGRGGRARSWPTATITPRT